MLPEGWLSNSGQVAQWEPEYSAATGFLPKEEGAVLKITAKNPGSWGNQMQVLFSPSSKAKTQILEVVVDNDRKKYKVKKAAGFCPGDIVAYQEQGNDTIIYNQVVSCQDEVLEFVNDFDDSVVDTELLPTKVISTCEFNMEVRFGDIVESYENVSFNRNEANYIRKKTEKSDLILVEYLAGEETAFNSPFEKIAGDASLNTVSMFFRDGSNGSVSTITAADFIGVDNGAVRRTGIQSFV